MEKERHRLPRGAAPLFLLLLPSLIFCALACASPAVALALDRTAGAPLRHLLSSAAARIAPSLTEGALLLLPLITLLALPLAILLARSDAATRRTVRALSLLLAAVTLLFALTFLTGLLTPPLAVRLGLSDEAPTASELISCAEWLSKLAEGREAAAPARSTVVARLREAYGRAGERYGFTANTAVPVKESATRLMARLGLFGLYAFPLGEVTVNADCPDGVAAFTVAHEMAHASGFSREEEADAVALLVALDSGDSYLAGAVAEGMLGRLLCTLAAEDPAAWQAVSVRLSAGTRRGIGEANESYEAGRYAPALVGEAPTYGRVVQLAVALYRRWGCTDPA